MAKKEEGLSYLQMPLPKEYKKSRIVKKTWSGYNRRITVDTGMLSAEKNISTEETPYLVPTSKMFDKVKYWNVVGSKAVGIFSFNSFVLFLFSTPHSSVEGTKNIYATVYDLSLESITTVGKALGVLKESENETSVVQFNIYSSPVDPVEGKYESYLLFFPFKKSAQIKADGFPATNENKIVLNEVTGMPDIKYATVHLSRLFGVDGERVYASGFNDYANWNIDTAEKYNESNAWCSTAGSNTKAGGKFTGITTFQNHVVCFKKDYMHEVYNTKNPFRIQDIYAEGSVDNRTIQDVDGQLIFVSEDAVKVYTGSNPRIISNNLGIKKFVSPVSGTDGRNYYLYCKDENDKKHLFTYDTYCGQWSRREVQDNIDIVMFACNSGKMYCAYTLFEADGDTRSYCGILNSDTFADWSFETDLMTSESCDIKHIEKLQMFCDINNGSKLNIYFLYDNEEFDEYTSHKVFSIENKTGKDIQKVIRVKPRMTAHHGFKVHVEGNGFVRIRSMELLVQGGGELYV